MAGITRVGAYIPFHRLGGDTVRAVWGSGSPRASRPLAGFDEDPITMGVEALINAAGWGDSQVDSLYFASTSHPYARKNQTLPCLPRQRIYPKNSLPWMRAARCARAHPPSRLRVTP